MAAAARRGGSDPALETIRSNLAALQGEIDPPSELEANIGRVRHSYMRALNSAIADYENTNPGPASRAAKRKIQNLKFALDAFYDFVRHRKDHESHEHVIGRSEVAQYLRDTLEDIIDHFG